MSTKIYIEVSIGGQVQEGRVGIELYDQALPVTCRKFISLCESKRLRGALFDRLIPDMFIQGGDIIEEELNDEGSLFPHNRAGLVSKTRNAQFYITLGPCPDLEEQDQCQVFGHVFSGMEVVRAMSQVSVTAGDRPTSPIVILDSGLLFSRKQTKRKRSDDVPRTKDTSHDHSCKRQHNIVQKNQNILTPASAQPSADTPEDSAGPAANDSRKTKAAKVRGKKKSSSKKKKRYKTKLSKSR